MIEDLLTLADSWRDRASNLQASDDKSYCRLNVSDKDILKECAKSVYDIIKAEVPEAMDGHIEQEGIPEEPEAEVTSLSNTYGIMNGGHCVDQDMQADGWYLDHGCLVFYRTGIGGNITIEAYAPGSWDNVFDNRENQNA
jgi:hypothetical protein